MSLCADDVRLRFESKCVRYMCVTCVFTRVRRLCGVCALRVRCVLWCCACAACCVGLPQVVCEATQCGDARVRSSAYECVGRVCELYYEHLEQR